MGNQRNRGFTIIEVMLFLAVTAALTVGLITGAQVAIERQRYRDTVTSFQAFLQEQYNIATNTISSRPDSQNCSTTGQVTATGASLPRGMTDCLIVGRYIWTSPAASGNGIDLNASNVIGYSGVAAASKTTDIETLRAMSLTSIEQATAGIDGIAYEKTSEPIQWGGRVVTATSHTDMPFKMLVIRGPKTGSILTFYNNDPAIVSALTPQGMVTLGTGVNTTPQLLCLTSTVTVAGVPISGRMMGVRIKPYATSQEAIEVPVETEKVCG